MENTFDINEAREDIMDLLMIHAVTVRDIAKENKLNNKNFDIGPAEEAEDIQDLFYDKKYEEGLKRYVTFMEKYRIKYSSEDLDMIKKFAKHIGSRIDELESMTPYCNTKED